MLRMMTHIGMPRLPLNGSVPSKPTDRLHMENVELPEDFREFLKLLNERKVKYLLIGGYAVGYYGYPRTTADIDIWIDSTPDNANVVVEVLHAFGVQDPTLTSELLREPGKILRIGLPPMRIEILNEIDGVIFQECYLQRKDVQFDGLPVPLISLADLKANKKASGRHKDLDDLDHLPDSLPETP